MVYGRFTRVCQGCLMRFLAPLLVAMSLATPVWAGELILTLTNSAGKPLADAVVMARPTSLARQGFRFPWANRMAQRNLAFDPFILIVPLGAEVAFPNLDPVKHHVYSFSATKTFELKLYSRDETRMVRFDKAGVVAIGCNIHDDMSAFIRVVDTPFSLKTGADGVAVIRGLPAGVAQVTVWHPYLKAPRNEIVRSLGVPASGAVRLLLTGDLRAPRMTHGAY